MKHIISILLCLFLCISCISSDSPTTTDKKGLTIENNKTYPGGVIKAKIVSDENIKSISIGIAGILKINKQKPEGNKWEGEADIPTLNPGKYEIAFVVKPFDAPSTTLTSQIEVVRKPTLDVWTSSVDGKKKITVKGEGIASVELLDNDPTNASRVSFKRNNNTFEYQGTPQPNTKLVITDVNGLIQEKNLSLETQYAIFFETYHNEKDIGNATYLSSQTENQTKCIQEERLMPYDQEDELLKSFLPNAIATKIVPFPGSRVLGISPNRRYLFLLSIYGLQMEKPTIDSGRRLMTVSLNIFFIYDRETKTKHFIDKYYRKTYHFIPKERCLTKEIGCYYYPVFWGQDELLVIQVRKGEDFVYGSEIEKYPQLETMNQTVVSQSLDATPKCMSISLKDFSMKESTKVKPITPWVCWADQYKGIISWASLTEPRASELAKLPDLETGCEFPNFVSDLTGEHVWNLPVIAKSLLGKDEKYHDTILISSTVRNDRKAILFATYSDKKNRICALDMETGAVEKIQEKEYDNSLDFNFSFAMLYGIQTTQNKDIALIDVTPVPVNPYQKRSPPKRDVNGFYIAQITKDKIDLLWRINLEPHRTRRLNPFFISEVVK